MRQWEEESLMVNNFYLIIIFTVSGQHLCFYEFGDDSGETVDGLSKNFLHLLLVP